MIILSRIALPVALTKGDTGLYLSANTAKFSSDYRAAASLYTSLWQKDSLNLDYAVDSLIFSVASGQVKQAVGIAEQALKLGLDSPLFGLVLIIDSFKKRELKAADKLLKRYNI